MVRTSSEAWARDDIQTHVVRATPETVQWGAFDASVEPVRRVRSGDMVLIECLAHHAGDAPDLMMDDGVRAVYDGIHPDDRGRVFTSSPGRFTSKARSRATRSNAGF